MNIAEIFEIYMYAQDLYLLQMSGITFKLEWELLHSTQCSEIHFSESFNFHRCLFFRSSIRCCDFSWLWELGFDLCSVLPSTELLVLLLLICFLALSC